MFTDFPDVFFNKGSVVRCFKVEVTYKNLQEGSITFMMAAWTQDQHRTLKNPRGANDSLTAGGFLQTDVARTTQKTSTAACEQIISGS